jgi:hypothetical protein
LAPWFGFAFRGQIMSHALAAIQENAASAADAFCPRHKPQLSRKRRGIACHNRQNTPARHARPKPGTFYRPRDHEASPFFRIVRDRFDEFKKTYPERYLERYGYWRPVIRSSIDKFLKCGDLKEGFARVRCPDCIDSLFYLLLHFIHRFYPGYNDSLGHAATRDRGFAVDDSKIY